MLQVIELRIDGIKILHSIEIISEEKPLEKSENKD